MASTSTPSPAIEATYLEADPEIRGQKFVCLSFLTPKPEFIREKRMFFISEFMKGYAFDHKIKATEGFIAEQYRALQNNLSDIEMDFRNLNPTTITMETLRKFCDRLSEKRGAISRQSVTDLESFVKSNMSEFRESDIVEAYEKFMLVHRQRLEDAFHAQKSFQTTMLGLKVRGSFSTREEANAFAKRLNKSDPNFNIYVADVGQWLPWDPSPEEIAEQEYPEGKEGDELNKLMKAYKENAAKATELFEAEKEATVKKAREEVAKTRQQKVSESGGASSGAPNRSSFHESGGVSESKSSSDRPVTNDMFDQVADLAIRRRMERQQQQQPQQRMLVVDDCLTGSRPGGAASGHQEVPASSVEVPANSQEVPASSQEVPASSQEAPNVAEVAVEIATVAEVPANSQEVPSVAEIPASSVEVPASSVEVPASSVEVPASSVEVPSVAEVPVVAEVPASSVEVTASSQEVTASSQEVAGVAEVPASSVEVSANSQEVAGVAEVPASSVEVSANSVEVPQ
jgi:hypothetical protein